MSRRPQDPVSRRRRRRGPPERMAVLVPPLLGSMGAPEGVCEPALSAAWDRAVGAIVAKNAQPVRVDSGVMTVHAKGSVWSAELFAQKTSILARLRAALHDRAPRDLRVRVGELPAPPVQEPRVAPPPIGRAPVPAEVEPALDSVADPALRARIRDTIALSLGAARGRR